MQLHRGTGDLGRRSGGGYLPRNAWVRVGKGPQGVWDKYLLNASCVPSAGMRVVNKPVSAPMDLTFAGWGRAGS